MNATTDALRQRYAQFSDEMLQEMCGRMADLTDEGQEALRAEVATRGLHTSSGGVAAPPGTPDGTPLQEQVDASKALYRGGLSMATKALALVAGAELGRAVASWPGQLGALWVGLLVVGFGFAGWLAGGRVALLICRQSDESIRAKRIQLLCAAAGFFVLLWVAQMVKHSG